MGASSVPSGRAAADFPALRARSKPPLHTRYGGHGRRTDVTGGVDVTLRDGATQRFQGAEGVRRRGERSRRERNRLPSF